MDQQPPFEKAEDRLGAFVGNLVFSVTLQQCVERATLLEHNVQALQAVKSTGTITDADEIMRDVLAEQARLDYSFLMVGAILEESQGISA